MSETQDMTVPAPSFIVDLRVILRGVFWRPWLVAGIVLFGSAAAILVALLMPSVYQSTARILVESQQIPDALARSTVTASAAERLALIEQRLMTRTNLLDISRRLEVFKDRDDLSPTDKVEILRKATRIESISFNSNPRYRGPTQVSAFTITFETDNALQAARVANEFVDMVLAQNLAARSERASETHDFFRAELERLSDELGTMETAIAAHKSVNKNHLPASMKLRLAEMTALRRQMAVRDARISRIEAGTDSSAIESGLTDASNTSPEQVAFNPMLKGQIDLLRKKQRMTRDRIVVLQNAIDRTTKVEMELNAMQRQFDLLKLQHKDALRKATAAATGEKLEARRQAERFEVIEPAQAPEAPVAPHRTFIVIGGVLGSLTLAIGLAGLLEWVSRIMRTSADFQRLLNVRPVMVFPPMPTRREVRQVRNRRIALSIAGAVAVGLGVWLSPIDLPQPDLPDFRISEKLQSFETVLLATNSD